MKGVLVGGILVFTACLCLLGAFFVYTRGPKLVAGETENYKVSFKYKTNVFTLPGMTGAGYLKVKIEDKRDDYSFGVRIGYPYNFDMKHDAVLQRISEAENGDLILFFQGRPGHTVILVEDEMVRRVRE